MTIFEQVIRDLETSSAELEATKQRINETQEKICQTIWALGDRCFGRPVLIQDGTSADGCDYHLETEGEQAVSKRINQEVSRVILEMAQILNDPKATEEEQYAAIDTIAEAVRLFGPCVRHMDGMSADPCDFVSLDQGD